MISPLFILYDCNDVLKKRIQRSTIGGTNWVLHVERGDKQCKNYEALVDNLFVYIHITQHHSQKRKEIER